MANDEQRTRGNEDRHDAGPKAAGADSAPVEGKAPEPNSAENRAAIVARLKAGQRVRVHQKVREGDKERVQVFEGTVLGHRGGTEPGATFTVRKTTAGIGVERIFPAFSPVITKIETVGETSVRRAKLTYLRDPSRKKKRKDAALAA